MPSPLSGAAVSEHKLASQVGTTISAAGGNAADAAVATVIANNTLCPYHSDIGGGGFAITRTPKGEYESLNLRHQGPVSTRTLALSVHGREGVAG